MCVCVCVCVCGEVRRVGELGDERVNRVRTRARACCLSSVKVCPGGACARVCMMYLCVQISTCMRLGRLGCRRAGTGVMLVSVSPPYAQPIPHTAPRMMAPALTHTTQHATPHPCPPFARQFSGLVRQLYQLLL